ncbi:chemotaxis protein CheB [Psychromarinibacter sp. S121]|uniref:chemotaxis protein CheB n=1 Tax=Psychromarinibacter sp. S121 TaxID=3415127 RepID=UPI003C7BCCFA
MVIVGVGASAGGLEATSLLVQNLVKNLNCVYVLAQHMSPSHKSMLVQLLARETSLAVAEIEDGTEPVEGTIYIPPSGSDVIYVDGHLQLATPMGHPASSKPSADRLFKSLAQNAGEYAVGIVLSGTGSDGSYGVQAIREAGGITIAQEPESCKYDSMPVSAIRTGCVDLTLTPQQIGLHLAKILERPRDLDSLRKMYERDHRNSDLFQILLAHTRVDFRHYKETTINRRIHRRMIAKGIEEFKDYVEHCRVSVEEVEALYRDLLISVTNFFRDPEQFNSLSKVLAERLARSPDAPVRIWVPGCATGEEAYSIAILAIEAMGGLDKVAADRLQVFATDIDERALTVGRAGVYPATALADIPQKYLARYFVLGDDRIEAKPRLKGHLMFTRHNVFQDAPFMSIDLVSIRNVLIYFEARLQERVLTRIQYALKQDGLLFLGTSETTGALEHLFSPVVPHAKIFLKQSSRLPAIAALEQSLPPDLRGRRPPIPTRNDPPPEDRKRFDALAKAVAGTGLLVNADKVVQRIFGDIAPFVEMKVPIHGNMTLNVLKKALAYDANSMMMVALKHDEPRFGQWHQIEAHDFNTVRMTAYPIKPDDEVEPLVLIAFETEHRLPPVPGEDKRSDYAEYLETELTRTRETLQVAIEQLQTSNEELQSLNEEMQSSNEELQSTNEELETSNEELQSTNEELITVNEELMVNSSQLERTGVELNGLIKRLPTVMMMLDPGLLIRHASQSAVETFEIRDRGQTMGHLSQCRIPPGYPPLVDICAQALVERRSCTRQFEVFWQLKSLTVTPLLTEADELIGLVVMIESMDMAGDTLLNETLRSFGNIGTWRLNIATGTLTWSDETFAIHGLPHNQPPPTVEAAIAYYMPEDQPRIRASLDATAKTGAPFHFFARMMRADGRVIVVESAGAAVQDKNGETVAMVGVFRDYTRARTDDLLVRHYDSVAAKQSIGFYSHDIENDLTYWSPWLHDLLGQGESEPRGFDAALKRFVPDSHGRLETCFRNALEKKESFDLVETILLGDGAKARCRVTGQVDVGDKGDPQHLFGTFELVT